jgi:hypothetical protein
VAGDVELGRVLVEERVLLEVRQAVHGLPVGVADDVLGVGCTPERLARLHLHLVKHVAQELLLHRRRARQPQPLR